MEESEIRIERRDSNTWAFINVEKGDVKNAKDIILTIKQRKKIEGILNDTNKSV